MRKPSQNFFQGITTYQGEPINKDLFFQQYEKYYETMKNLLDVELLEANESFPDAQYVEVLGLYSYYKPLISLFPGSSYYISRHRFLMYV